MKPLKEGVVKRGERELKDELPNMRWGIGSLRDIHNQVALLNCIMIAYSILA